MEEEGDVLYNVFALRTTEVEFEFNNNEYTIAVMLDLKAD